MDSTLMSTRSYPPSSKSSLSQRRSKFFSPLSHHGLPKTPGLPASPRDGNFSHRISTVRPLMAPAISSPPLTPLTPMSPMSPPMSARSFGTFIESEPSTPAYSPRSGSSNWDSNTLLLLSPVSSVPSSTPATPMEPVWEMVAPIKQAQKPSVWPKHSRTIPITSSEIPAPTISTESEEENTASKESEKVDGDHEGTSQVETSHLAPLGKLATKMKSILRRKTVSEKKEKKIEKRKRGYADLDRMEDVHWTEM